MALMETKIPLQAGRLLLLVSLNGIDISKGGVIAYFGASDIFPQACTISGADIYGCVAGTNCSFLLTSKDKFGNVRRGVTDTFTATSANASSVVVSLAGSGAYRVLIACDVLPSKAPYLRF